MWVPWIKNSGPLCDAKIRIYIFLKKLDYTNPLAPVGSCSSNCSSNGNTTICCAESNCNNVLMCYTGSYIQKGGDQSVMIKSVCPASKSSFCQV
jgi:hypothetical protein